MTLHVHLDLVGGIAGDMFVAAMLDAFPAGFKQCQSDLGDSGVLKHVDVNLEEGMSHGIRAQRFLVEKTDHAPVSSTRYSHLKQLLHTSDLREPVKQRALQILKLLAKAESTIHAVDLDDVHFHEVADWDSVADVVAAASLVEFSQVDQWSCGPVPSGSGLVDTQHGKLPVPAPATLELLKGFTLWDDGEPGERVTPTGAAILRYILPDAGNQPGENRQKPQGVLVATGTGAGSRQLTQRPNIVRCTVMENTDGPQLAVAADTLNNSTLIDEIAELNFAIDDMTPEELSVACEHIRVVEGVIDVSSLTGTGKKGRVVFHIVVLCEPYFENPVCHACFVQTSTLGIRIQHITRRILNRSEHRIGHDENDPDGSARVKVALRPGHVSAKVASDDLQNLPTLEARREKANKFVYRIKTRP